MVARKIDLEEKRVFVPTPMTQEPYFCLPVAVAPAVQSTVVPTPVCGFKENEENNCVYVKFKNG